MALSKGETMIIRLQTAAALTQLPALFLTPTASALTIEQINGLKNAVIELCRGRTLEGTASNYRVEVHGGITKVIIPQLGADAQATFSGEEWKGIKDNVLNQADWNACVNKNMPLFFDRFSETPKLPTPAISSIVAGSGRFYPLDLDGISLGKRVWTDREATFSVIPAFLQGAVYIITANEDKFAKGDKFLSFYIAHGGYIYVAYDVRYSRLPQWLESFLATRDNVAFTFGPANYPMRLYRKHFDSGPVDLGGPYPDGETGNYSMYSVIFKE
jgi:hypothetical protein